MKDTLQRFKTSPTIKMMTIGFIIMILLVPATMIKSIIQERQQLRQSAITEVSSKWANSQTVDGPILSIPYTKAYEVNEEVRYSKHLFHILPEKLKVNGQVGTEALTRGIYEVVVYASDLNVDGMFSLEAIEQLHEAHDILYDQAFVTIGMSDLRGIQSEIFVQWGDDNYEVEPGSKISKIISSGVTVYPTIDKTKESFKFGYQLTLNGSRNLSFIPVGGITEVQISSDWSSPSFGGHILPDDREVRDDGFTASWKILELNRDFPSYWSDQESTKRGASSFGLDLIIPVDDYQKSIRSAKYAILVISTTFLIFFLVELLYKRKVHPFQYTLVGLALCLFYILLISISEHSTFDFAYAISAIGVVVMIGLYSLSVFKSSRHSLVLVLVLTSLYGFLYVTLRLVDYALLMGALGLALMLAATMYFTRKVDWYGLTDRAVSKASPHSI